jgi:hypothetical protein
VEEINKNFWAGKKSVMQGKSRVSIMLRVPGINDP